MRQLLIRTFLITLLAVLVSPDRLSAKLFLITHGDTINKIGDMPSVPGMDNPLQLAGFTVGYKYSYFGVFWLDFWTWGGEFCVFKDKNFQPITKADAALILGKPEAELATPFLYRFPLGLVIIVGLAAVFIPLAIIGKAAEKRTQRLFEDERYQKAMEILSAPAEKHEATLAQWEENAKQAQEKGDNPPPQPEFPADAQEVAHEKAIQHLVSEGIPQPEAEKNLKAMLEHIAQQSIQPGT